MNVQQAVKLATAKLSHNIDSAYCDARILTCHACAMSQTTLIAHPEFTLNSEQENLFQHYLARRVQGEPLAYITGTKEFWSLNFIVNRHVLIPRPETELLVELALNQISSLEAPRILDLGTGSGAIAISIAKQHPECSITASDDAKLALETAKQNAALHNVNIRFIKSDWFEKITNDRFDIIISNPPYIGENDKNLDTSVYLHEPTHALISEHDGLNDLTKIITTAKNHLSASGQLIVEHGFQQAELIQKCFIQEDFNDVFSYKDLSGHPRCTSGCVQDACTTRR